MHKKNMFKASNLSRLSGIRHGFFSRLGGISTDVGLSGLNCGFGSNDTFENVEGQEDGSWPQDLYSESRHWKGIRKPWR